jgi:guanylate kinase
VISGPSGVGKSSIVDRLAARMPFTFSVSATTRPPRPAERDGVDYRFVDGDRFAELRGEGELLECAEYSGHWYGTPRAPVLAALDRGEDVLLDIENLGAEQVKRSYPEAVLVFVAPPSWDDLERRLTNRGDTAPEGRGSPSLGRPVQMESATSVFDHIVVNDHLDAAVDRIVSILSAPTTDEVPPAASGTGRASTARDAPDIEEPATRHDD